mmetsp:Transcript_28773/g.88222  ORF Transcript_28773/g.88222 Transcript_28773/m.88222 type:complete len:246 (-) Transcript_28773:889-1626(-)
MAGVVRAAPSQRPPHRAVPGRRTHAACAVRHVPVQSLAPSGHALHRGTINRHYPCPIHADESDWRHCRRPRLPLLRGWFAHYLLLCQMGGAHERVHYDCGALACSSNGGVVERRPREQENVASEMGLGLSRGRRSRPAWPPGLTGTDRVGGRRGTGSTYIAHVVGPHGEYSCTPLGTFGPAVPEIIPGVAAILRSQREGVSLLRQLRGWPCGAPRGAPTRSRRLRESPGRAQRGARGNVRASGAQ